MPGTSTNGLLLGVSGGFDDDEAIGCPQAGADLAYNASNLPNTHHHHAPGLPRNASAYQTAMALADPHRFSHLTVSQDFLPALNGPFDLNAIENVRRGNLHFGPSLGQVRPQTISWESGEPMGTGSLDQYIPAVAIPHQAIDGIRSNVVWPSEQHRGHGQPGRSMQEPSVHHPGTSTGIQQSQTVHNATGGHLPTTMNMYGFSDGDSHGTDTGAIRLDQDLSSVQSQNIATTSAKSLTCPICKHQSKNRPGLRHHLDIHNQAKTSKYKCNNRGCEYASRYRKDVRRHQLVHKKPDDPEFVCREPGCDSKFHRNDSLLRHGRSNHPDSASGQSTGTTANSRLGNRESSSVDVPVNARRSVDGPRATLLESFDFVSNHSAGASLNRPGLDVNRNLSFSSPQTAGSSFSGYLDPRLLSPSSTSDSCCFSGTESPYPK